MLHTNFIDELLKPFKKLFKDHRTYKNFRKTVYGFLAASDILGLTSLIAGLFLDSKEYDHLQNYFKDGSWNLDEINEVLIQMITSMAPLHHINGRLVACGDGKKEPTDGKKIPAVAKECIESESVSKRNGLVPCLNYSCISFVCDASASFFSLLVLARIANGNKEIEAWQGRKRVTQPAKMARDFQKIVEIVKQSFYLVLDRFYLSETILKEWAAWHENRNPLDPRYDLVMRAKTNVKAYTQYVPEPDAIKGRGRPRQYVEHHLNDFFNTRKEDFQPLEFSVHGETTRQEVLCETFLWGSKKRPLKFVLSRKGDKRIILASTDLELSPQEIIEAYMCRFSIETSFRQGAENFGMFNARFHTQCLEPFNFYARKEEPSPCAKVVLEEDKKKVLKTVRAHEGFVLHSMIAMAVAQLYRLECMEDPSQRIVYMRTFGSQFSLQEAKKDLSISIFHDLSCGGISDFNSLLGPDRKPLYHVKESICMDRGRYRKICRAC